MSGHIHFSNSIVLASFVALLSGCQLVDKEEEVLLKSVIVWTPNAEIYWSDYQGVPNENTSDNFQYWHGFYLKRTGCDEGDYKVVTIFDKRKSWVKDTLAPFMENELLLQRLRFDLYEIRAQKFRAFLAENGGPCALREDDIDAKAEMLESEVEKIWGEMLTSVFSSPEAKIQYWQRYVDNEMKKVKID